MKYIFLCSLILLTISPTNIGYGLTSQRRQIPVCGRITFKGKPLSNFQIRFGYKLNPVDNWKYIETKTNQSGDYCVDTVPTEVFKKNGIINVIAYYEKLLPFTNNEFPIGEQQGKLSSFNPKIELEETGGLESGKTIRRAFINVTVKPYSDTLPTPSPLPSQTVKPPQSPSPTQTVKPTPSPTRTIINQNTNSNLTGIITPTPTVEVPVTPTPTIKVPGLPPSKIDEILAKMNLGNIAFVTPEAMTLEKSETVYLRLSIAQTIEELKQEIQNEGIKGQVNAVGGIKIDSQMQAVLTGGDDFKVTPITPDTLPISNQTTTEWKWDIKALRGGNLKLYLTLNAIVEYEDGAGKRPVTIRTFNKEYTVAVPWSENAVFKFAGNNWQWLWTTLIVPIGLWAWNRKRKKTRPSGIAAYQEEKKTKAGFVKEEGEKKSHIKES